MRVEEMGTVLVTSQDTHKTAVKRHKVAPENAGGSAF